MGIWKPPHNHRPNLNFNYEDYELPPSLTSWSGTLGDHRLPENGGVVGKWSCIIQQKMAKKNVEFKAAKYISIAMQFNATTWICLVGDFFYGFCHGKSPLNLQSPWLLPPGNPTQQWKMHPLQMYFLLKMGIWDISVTLDPSILRVANPSPTIQWSKPPGVSSELEWSKTGPESSCWSLQKQSRHAQEPWVFSNLDPWEKLH